MKRELLIRIKSEPNLYHYLKNHSYWYKELKRNPSSIVEMEELMKIEYKLTTADKINNVSEKITMVRTFLDMMD